MLVALSLVLAAQPPELGKVPWERSFDVAVERARTSGKPLLVLFDEVPGCSTVLGFGESVLSDAEVVERITRDFVPVAVFNNVGGADAKVLASFNEPSWNNPVVRVVDAERRPLAPRFDGPYTKQAFLAVLAGAKPQLEKATLSAACFWECEAKLGSLEAVRASRVGFLQGEEVVEVEFDPNLASRESFLAAARQLDCGERVYTRSADEQRMTSRVQGVKAIQTSEALRLSEKDTKYFLKASRREKANLSELERVRLNAKAR